MEKNRSIRGVVRWEPYQNVKIENQELLGDLYINKISLYKKDGFYFSDLFEMFGYTNIVSLKHINSFDFKLHRYRKRVTNSDGSYTSYPMAILLFEQDLSDKYFICIENDSISLTYKNYVFFVSLSSSQFLYKGLNVHHEYYINGHKPWEYEDQALVTLCEECHGKRHKSDIPIYKSKDDKQIEYYCKKCDKCGGTGYLPQYKHVENGICFKCGGEGVIVV